MSDPLPLQVFAANGEPIDGQSMQRSEFTSELDVNKGSTHIWIWRTSGNGEREVLLQLRSKNKLTWPGFYDASVAGHVDVGESFIAAGIREAKEEIGLDINPDDLHWHFAFRQPSGTICHVYTLNLPEASEFSFDDGEVERLDWIKVSEFTQWAKNPSEHNLVEDGERYFNDVVAAISVS